MKIAAWFNVLAGVWLILSPFVLGFSNNSSLLWNNIILGMIVIVFGLILTSTGKQPDII